MKREAIVFSILLILGGLLRFWGISYGLPAVFNADEPHLVNLAVYYGSGDLNPHVFKYPTLWTYLLFFCFGIYYLAWSLFGLWRSVEEFGYLFVWDPTGFYLLARSLAALSSCLGLWAVYRMGRKFFSRSSALWTAAFLAVSPALVESAHAAKPESLMLLFCAGAWYFSFKILETGRRKDYLFCGLFLGLASSTQYTAAPLWILLPLAHGLRRMNEDFSWPKALKDADLWLALSCALGAFAAGSPYSLLDLPSFLANFRDLSHQMELARVSTPVSSVAVSVIGNIFGFAGAWSLASAALFLGAIRLWSKERNKALLLLMPILLLALFLSFQPKGGNARYLFPIFPALAVLASLGAEAMEAFGNRRLLTAALCLALFLPGGCQSYAFDSYLNLPDTRTLASAWIQSNIPEGTSLLMDQPHASPPLPPSLDQIKRLYDKTLEAGHPRSRYYKLLLDSHPGGGYEIYQILRGYLELDTQPGHVEWSRKGYELLDVRKGLNQAREKVRYVVTTSHGATPEGSPELQKFFRELREQAVLIREFLPEKGKKTGPAIRIYRL